MQLTKAPGSPEKERDLDKAKCGKERDSQFPEPNRKTDMIDELKQNIETEIEVLREISIT